MVIIRGGDDDGILNAEPTRTRQIRESHGSPPLGGVPYPSGVITVRENKLVWFPGEQEFF